MCPTSWRRSRLACGSLSSVREYRDGDDVIFDVVTGEPDGGWFASHGHTMRLIVRLAAT